jgi:hypothetical protein
MSGLLNLEIFDHHIGEQLLGHIFKLGLADAFVMLDFDQAPCAHIVHALETKALKRVVDGLPLRIENAIFQGNEDAGFHVGAALIDADWRPYSRASGRGKGPRKS